MLKMIVRHLTLALIFFALTLSQQYLFYYLKGLPIVWLTLGKYFGTFAFLFAATFIRPHFLRYTFLSLVLLLNFFQMAHLSYFGTQILPNEFLLIIPQFHEIQGSLLVEYHHVLIPLLFTLVPAVLGFYALKKANILYGTKILGILFCVYFIYNPARTYVTGNTWGRQPSTRELTGMNFYLSFSYFAGKILPNKLRKGQGIASNSSTELSLLDGSPSDWDKIIVILGESLTPHHMSLFGYQRPTTPFLLSQAGNPNFFHTIGLSGGVSTDIAVAFLLNMGFGDGGGIKAAKGEHCLFKLAKQKNYTTHFHSIQSSEQLRYIAPYVCTSSLDDYKSLEDIAPETPDHQAASDRDLLKNLEQLISFDQKQFIFLHQRGSHGPTELRSSKEAQIFPHNERVNYYDNSVVEFDLFMKQFHELVSKSGKKILALYVSDHGEAMGQEGKWGHGQLIRPAFEVPVIIMSFNKTLPASTSMIPKYVTHYNLGLFLSNELGHKPNQDPTSFVKDYVIYGNDIDGFAGKASVSFKPDGTYDFKVVD